MKRESDTDFQCKFDKITLIFAFTIAFHAVSDVCTYAFDILRKNPASLRALDF